MQTEVTLTEMLKAKTVEEIPYVDGYLSQLGVEDYSNLSEADRLTVAYDNLNFSEENKSLSENNKTIASNFAIETNKFIKSFEENIGKETEFTYIMIISVDMENLDDYKNYEINAKDESGTIDITSFEIKSAEELYNDGIENAEAKIAEVTQLTKSTRWTAKPISNLDTYNRIKARDYALKWTNNSGSTYTTSYNNAVYTNYSPNDCANFVSQCLKEGGVPTTTTWKAGTTAWINVGSLTSYMSSKGYAINTTYENCTAGNYANDSGHIVMITYNDGAKLKYSAHTNNRLDVAVSTSMLTSYSYWVIKNY